MNGLAKASRDQVSITSIGSVLFGIVLVLLLAGGVAPASALADDAAANGLQAGVPNLSVQADGNGAIAWANGSNPLAFDNTSVGLIKKSYLAVTQDGYMRVVYDGTSLVIEYYDNAFRMMRQGRLDLELPIWGGFYAGNNAYYLVEGQKNKDGVDGTEVLRIVKYDKNWNRIGAGSIYAQEGWEYEIRYPFDYSCVNMAEVAGKLYVITGREGYVDPQYGQGHQGMMLIRMDEASFATEIVYGDFWHSFAQYMCANGTDLYLGELSEGSRATMLSRFDATSTGTDYFNALSDRFSVLEYGGSRTSAWSIPCYASVDDMAISSTNVLCVGTSIDQSLYDSAGNDTPHNIYIATAPLSSFNKDASKVIWLTSYEGGNKCFYGLNITKINDDRFLITWEEFGENTQGLADNNDTLSGGVLHYQFIDGAGQKIGNEHTAAATISDCKPALSGGKVVYFASNSNCLDFYSIDAQTGEFGKSVLRIAGDNATWEYNDGVLSFSGKGELRISAKSQYRRPLSLAGSITYTGGGSWKDLQDLVTGISIGEGITLIPERAFAYLDNLQTVSLPSSLKTIQKEAFYSCDTLRKLEIPDSVTEIGDDILWVGSFWTSDNSHVVYATIYGGCTSYAIEYAQANKIRYNVIHTGDITEQSRIEPTCTVSGTSTKKCSACEQTFNETIPAPGHSWSSDYTVDRASTCYYEGSESIHCIVCDVAQANSSRAIAKLPHSYGDWYTSKEATCTAEGEHVRWCEVCYDRQTEAIPMTPHSEEVVPAVAATCTEAGLTAGKKCSVCGKVLEAQQRVEPIPHSWADGYTVDKPATCTEEGSESIHCAVCGTVKEGSERVIDKTAHEYGEWKVVKEATCTAEGKREHECKVCRDKQTEVIPTVPHSEEAIPAVAATCTEAGLTEGKKCSTCGKVLEVQQRVEPIPHSWQDAYTVDVPATCATEGGESIHCSVCGAVKGGSERSIPVSDKHTYGEWVVTEEATCTEEGLRVRKCEVCGAEVSETVSATGHSYGDWKVIKSASCTAEGEMAHECSNCNDVETKVIPAKGHVWAKEYTVDKAPTLTAEGSESIHCTVCDVVKEGSTRILPKLKPTEVTAADAAKMTPAQVAKAIPAEVSPSTPASAAVVDRQLTTAKSDADPKGAGYGLLQAKGAPKSKTANKVTWKKVKGATAYAVYANKCGKANQLKKVKTVKGTSFTHSKLKKGTYYKYLVVALKGGKALATSKVIHVATKGGKVGNSKSVAVTNASKGKLTLKKGKTFKLKVKTTPQSRKLAVKKHRAVAFESSNKKIATVTKAGVVKAKKKGTCYVYAYAQNGVCKAVKVTVK